jgi:hypothetical protein
MATRNNSNPRSVSNRINNTSTNPNARLANPALTQGGAYVLLGPGDMVVSNDSVTAAMWSDNNPTLNIFYTSSTQVSSNVAEYYTSVYQTASVEVSAEIQFDIAYGDVEGSGSHSLNKLVTGSTPTRTTYGQYRNLVLGDENASFVFANVTSSYWYAMPIERARYKQSILPGTWTLALQGYTSTVVTTVISTGTQLDPLSQTVVPGTYAAIASADMEWCYEDGSAIITTAANPLAPTIAGTANLIGLTATGFTSIQFTVAPTNIQVGNLLKILGSAVGGVNGSNDIYIRVNPSFVTAGDAIKLTDNSKLTATTQFCDAGRIFQIVSGSAGVLGGNLKNVNGYTATSGSYGYLLPDINTLLLNGEALDALPQGGGINIGTSRSFDASGNNALRLVNALNRAGDPIQGNTGFTINSKEDLSSDYIFCRARNSEYNYSANPSFISSSTGAVLFSSFIENPTTYITTVGLYTRLNELVAVAKLSRPLEKNFTKELLVRVKLDF